MNKIAKILHIASLLIKTASSESFDITDSYLQQPITGYKNPTLKQIKQSEKYDQVRAILSGGDMYVWQEAIHRSAIRSLKMEGNSNVIPLNVFLHGNKIVGVTVTDFSNNTKWKHNPKLRDAIVNNKWIRLYSDPSQLKDPNFVGYYDEAIVGPWHDL